MPLLASPFVRALPDDWRDTLDEVARGRDWPSSRDPGRLAPLVAKLSAAYNAPGSGSPADRERPLRADEALAARLGFSFARDVPKASGAVRELAATGNLGPGGGGVLRVLDLGAGLGASTWGVALAAEGRVARVESVCVDKDEGALSLAAAIARARRGRDRVPVAVETVRASIETGVRGAGPGFDVVVIGQALSELSGKDPSRRVAEHAELLHLALGRVKDDGSVVIVEPALRDRTRHLHAVRDALLASREHEVTVFAPCLHQAPCPALASEEAWCHEDLEVDLPGWLVPVARAAGLRFQGLTFSYLVLRKDGRSLRTAIGAPATRLARVVSGPIATKGKHEAFVCGELGAGPPANEAAVAHRLRLMRLDRDATGKNSAWEEARRGDLLALSEPVDPGRPRLGKTSEVTRVTPVARAQGQPGDPTVVPG